MQKPLLILLLVLALTFGIPGCSATPPSKPVHPEAGRKLLPLTTHSLFVREVRNLSGRPIRHLDPDLMYHDNLELVKVMAANATLDFPALIRTAMRDELVEQGYAVATEESAELEFHLAVVLWEWSNDGRGDLRVGLRGVVADAATGELLIMAESSGNYPFLNQVPEDGPVLGPDRIIAGRYRRIATLLVQSMLNELSGGAG